MVRGAAPVVRAYEKYMEGASGVYGRCTALGMSFVCLSMPGVWDYPAGWCSHGRFPWMGARRPELLLPAVLGSCTGLYVAVRRIGGAEARRTYIWRTASPADSIIEVVCAGQRLCGGAGRSGLTKK